MRYFFIASIFLLTHVPAYGQMQSDLAAKEGCDNPPVEKQFPALSERELVVNSMRKSAVARSHCGDTILLNNGGSIPKKRFAPPRT